MTVLIAFSIFSVVWHWADYFWTLQVINTMELATPSLGTMFFMNKGAGTVIITLPLLIFSSQH